MSDLVEQLQALGELHRAGSLNDSEFAAAKARLLQEQNGGAPQAPSVSLLALQNDLARIDREWELEREQYQVVGRYNSSIPKPGEGTGAGTVATIFGLIWLGFALFIATGATSHGAPPIFWVFPLFGVFFIGAGLYNASEMNRKADAYQLAEQSYRSRRAQLTAKMREVENVME